ncbi:thermonuclease family protein [Myxococcota bacterium]|nr:thermonuclease family protein [Myxococcota bacterium]MBU1535580.1 thermonuclease family protein [Myxococcota bacterium]
MTMRGTIMASLVLSSLIPAWFVSCKKQSEGEEIRPPSRSSGQHKRRGAKKRSRDHRTLIIESGEKIFARVVHVVDGDTIHLRTEKDNLLIKGRLSGVNTPECHKVRVKTLEGKNSAQCKSDDEAGGLDAFVFLKKRIYGKRVGMDCIKKGNKCQMGRFGRPLVTVFLGPTDVNQELISRGHGFTFTKYPSPRRARYCQAEFAARKAKVGVWRLGETVDDVLSLMSAKTRRWYKKHDALCRESIQGR